MLIRKLKLLQLAITTEISLKRLQQHTSLLFIRDELILQHILTLLAKRR